MKRLERFKWYLKWNYEEELIVKSDGYIDHNSCISHCLPYAFGKYISKHEIQCSDCDQLFEFLDFLYKSVFLNSYFQIIEFKEKLLYYLSHQTWKKYLNA